MVKKRYNNGFSLTEVLVATIVMSMILGSVLGFVQYAGDIWHKGNTKLSTSNYSRMAFEMLKQDLLKAIDVSWPTKGTTKKNIKYKIDNNASFQIIASGTTLIKQALKDNGAVDSNSKPMRIARNVKYFNVSRLSTWTFQINLQITEDRQEELYDDDNNLIPLQIISSDSMVLIAPGLK